MKIAFAIYPDIDLIDLLLLTEPFTQMDKLDLKPQNLKLDFCAPNWISYPFVLTLNELSIKPFDPFTLVDYETVIVAGSEINPISTTSTSAEMKHWFSSINPKANLVVTGNALSLIQSSPEAKDKQFASVLQANNRLECIQLGIKLVELVAGKDISLRVATNLGLLSTITTIPTSEIRQFSISRKTKETSIELKLSLDGSGKIDISTGIPFFDHMLTQIAVHGLFDLSIQCKGDLQIDPHHTVEDVALALGKAFDQALGDRKGLVRMASATVPMDESLAQVNLDFSGRPYTVVEVDWNDVKVGDLPTTLITHFLESFATQARCNLSVRLLAGGDDHHRAEAIFKALARALDTATQIDPRRLDTIPSSKGVI